MTLADKLKLTGNRPSGFDYLRISLAVGVIASHAGLICYGRQFDDTVMTSWFRPLHVFLVPSFFALSGFLVASSLERNNLATFLMLRFIRIFPALSVEVLISALIIGGLVTNLPLTDYFTDPEFARYFWNLIGHIQYTLPGVFHGMPAGNYVNLQLWTVPRELECYILISLIAVIGLYKRPILFLLLLVSSCALILIYQIGFGGFQENFNRPRGALPVLCFLFGVALYALRSVVPFNFGLFVACLAVTWLTTTFADATYLGPLALAYVTVFLGLLNPKRTLVVAGADYSYGIYLYGFPIQQMIAFFLPSTRIWIVNVVLSVIVSGICAYLSWTFIESKVLKKKKTATDLTARLMSKLQASKNRPLVAEVTTERVKK